MIPDLIKSAKTLSPPDQAALAAFVRSHEQLATQGSDQLIRRPDIETIIGSGNLEMAKDNNKNFSRFMVSLFSEYNPEVLVNTVLWVFRTYRSRGFQPGYWEINLNIWVDLLQTALPADAYEQIYPFYQWLIVNIPHFTRITDTDTDIPMPDLSH